ncbi:hypothetical protein QMZ62_05205 [Serratia sp. PF2-63]|uniref:hypothetical protein n=1 Tax=Serratia TaxID=613 RepID=UPI00217BF602|nr:MULTISPECIES: hypothetical protein [Serratia]MDI6973388.1 hypothetical protein [Serratia sp. Se-RSBMAAmG]MDI9262357.1 hypothetical protein [Serratia sp. PF2-63]MDI9271209.1 hypothetical protein [Serratia sp. PF-27]CAI1531800.1 Uncharacterised protein [Serratia marcescens]
MGSNRIDVSTEIKKMGYSGAVYRFFDEQIYADNFCNGLIRVSTLEACRKYEHPEKGDKGEASWKQYINTLCIKNASKEIRAALKLAGVDISPESKGNIINRAKKENVIPNAYVLCGTKHFEPKTFQDSFGKYCVEISNAHEFCLQLSEKIAIHHKGVNVHGDYDDVTYMDRIGIDLQGPRRHIGFIKPVIPYAKQKEFRFLWTLEDPYITLEKLDIVCPEIVGMCKRII